MICIEELEKLKPERYPRNDIGTSSLFVNVYRYRMIYISERKSFFVFSGKVWKKDYDDLAVHELAKEFALSMQEYANKKLADNDDAMKYYSKYTAREKRVKLINDAKSIDPRSVDIFDRQVYLFNCQNCTVNLATGEVHAHDALDYLTKMSNVWYDPVAKSEEFENFIKSIMKDDPGLIDYLQQALGYSLTAATFQECFFITYGSTTRNGKGTLNGTMMYLMGDYAKNAQFDTFQSKQYKTGNGASEDIARLAGARYVSVSEPPKGSTLDAALIKTLSGNDKITARFLYEGSFEFTANFKLWINTNYLPNIPDTTVFKSDRVQLIPFNRHFDSSEQDRGLKSRLIRKENISGAFNWCMEGFKRMSSAGGLTMPEAVRKDLAKYMGMNDRIGEFIEECLIEDLDGKHREKLTKVYKMYTHWCRGNGYQTLNKKNFTGELSERVIVSDYGRQKHLEGYFISEEVPVEWVL